MFLGIERGDTIFGFESKQVWFARQNRLTEYWPRMKPNYSTKMHLDFVLTNSESILLTM